METADVLLKVTLVLGTAFVATRLLTRGSAAMRHQIWAVALVASLMMPVLAAVAPRWQIAVLPAPTATLTPVRPAAALPVMVNRPLPTTLEPAPVRLTTVPAVEVTVTAVVPTCTSDSFAWFRANVPDGV